MEQKKSYSFFRASASVGLSVLVICGAILIFYRDKDEFISSDHVMHFGVGFIPAEIDGKRVVLRDVFGADEIQVSFNGETDVMLYQNYGVKSEDGICYGFTCRIETSRSIFEQPAVSLAEFDKDQLAIFSEMVSGDIGITGVGAVHFLVRP